MNLICWKCNNKAENCSCERLTCLRCGPFQCWCSFITEGQLAPSSNLIFRKSGRKEEYCFMHRASKQAWMQILDLLEKVVQVQQSDLLREPAEELIDLLKRF